MIQATFLGTGTSQGVPEITCNCSVCKSTDPKNTRLRTSIHINCNGKDIVIDAGPDFRQQMLANKIKNVDAICITHEHRDHVAGLDDIRPFNFAKQKAMDIYAEQNVMEAIKQTYHYVFKKEEEKYPGVPAMNLVKIDNSPFKIEDLQVTPIRVMHWELPILGFRIENFAYITDAKTIAEEELQKLQNLDALVVNALRKQRHYSHFNLEEALDLIKKLKPQKAYLTHISHLMGDHNEVQAELPQNVYLAYDGLKFSV